MTLTLGRFTIRIRGDEVRVWDAHAATLDPITTARWSTTLGCHDAHGASLREGTWDDIDETIRRALDPNGTDPNHNP